MSQSPIQKIDPSYDVVIVGGGIVGAGIFRDLALHGENVLLIDARDFGSQTSTRSSKMLHGGIRYLEGAHFGLVWEALHEKNFWLKNSPELCEERPFYMPVFKDSKYPLCFLRMGLLTYDTLSGFKNTPSKAIGKKETLKKIPELKEQGLTGAGVYCDAIVDDGKITLECLYDGLKNSHCQVLNYVEMNNIVPHKNGYQLTIEDKLEGITRYVCANHVIFATGPFTDQLLSRFPFLKWENCLLPSKGIHLWLERSAITIEDPMVLQTKDGRVVFVIPHPDSILVGTTEKVVQENFFDIEASDEEIDYLLAVLNSYFPKLNLNRSQILSTYAGIRPLVREGNSKNSTKTSRHHKVVSPKENIHVIMGGKLTTFRTMGQEISKKIVQGHGKKFDPDLTRSPLRVPSLRSPHEKKEITEELVLEIAKREYVRTFEDLLKRRLGILSKKHWKHSQDFVTFFMSFYDKLKKLIPLTEEEIRNF